MLPCRLRQDTGSRRCVFEKGILAGFGGRAFHGSPTVSAAFPAPRAADVGRGLPRRSFNPISEPAIIVNMEIVIFVTSAGEADQATPGSVPCFPPDSPIRPPDRRKSPPVRRRRQAPHKYLI